MTHVESLAHTTRPSGDPFYGPAHTLPPAGTLIRSRRVSVLHEAVGSATQLVYASTGARGQRIPVSGTLLQPATPWRGPGPQPVVTYGVGVHGLSRDAAPSHLLVRGEEAELVLVAEALARGWTALITDGDGLGMPGPHTYGAGLPGGHAMLDIVRAAADIQPAIAAAPVVAWGYSEGGRCAAWAGELQPDYAPGIDLVAVAAGGVPSDLREMARALEDGPFAGLNLAVLVGLAHAHQDPALLRILTDEGRCAAQRAAHLDVVGLILELPEPLRTHTVRDEPWDDPTWCELLRRERAGQRRPEAPVLLYHVEHDALVPTALGLQLAESYRRLGAHVEWHTVTADDHLSGAYAGSAIALDWLEAQLA